MSDFEQLMDSWDTEEQDLVTRALSGHASWFHAIVHLGKWIENRKWKPPQHIIGKRIAIHASATVNPEGLEAVLRVTGHQLDPETLVRSAFIGTARVVGWVSADEYYLPDGWLSHLPLDRAETAKLLRSNPWFFGPYGWVLDHIRPLPVPVPHKGHLSLWKVPEALVPYLSDQEPLPPAEGAP
jgi:hypothetical protein